MWPIIDELCYKVESHSELFLQLPSSASQQQVETIMVLAWALWRACNDLVWNQKPSTSLQVFHSTVSHLQEWKEARIPRSRGEKDRVCGKWHAPKLEFMKINVDASLFVDSRVTGVGMIIHDHIGEFVACRTLKRKGIMKVDEGEAWGVMEAIKWGAHLGLDRVVVETDSKQVADAYCSADVGDSTFGNYIEGGRLLRIDRPHFSVSWVARSANYLAHTLSMMSRDYDSPHCWVEAPSSVAFQLDMCTICT